MSLSSPSFSHKAMLTGMLAAELRSEEGGQAAFTQAAEHQRVGVAVQVDEDDEWVDDQRHEQHRAHQQQQQAAVLGKRWIGRCPPRW